jgi:hypothetical protein
LGGGPTRKLALRVRPPNQTLPAREGTGSQGGVAMIEKEREVLKDTDLYRYESVEISGKRLYMYFHVSYIKNPDRLEEYVQIAEETVSGSLPILVARLKVGDKFVEYHWISISDVYGGDLYIKRITEDRPCKKYGILHINYHEYAEFNYVFFYKEKDEFGEADQFDYLIYGEMMEEMVRYVEEGAEVLYLSEDKYDPVEYKRLVLRDG